VRKINNSAVSSVSRLSILMLVKDGMRWEQFVSKRLQELEQVQKLGAFPFEVVIVLNGPADPAYIAREIVEYTYQIIVNFHGENHIPRGRNLSVHAASSDLVMIWDDDDALLEPAALPEFVEAYQSSRVAVLCAPLLRQGKTLHPQPPEQMPQYTHWENPKILLTGMQHTPCLTLRQIAAAFRLSEVRRLRGEWIDWSTRLWRAGLPIGYLKETRCVFEDENEGKSATRFIDSFTHSLISILCLAFEYGLTPGSYSAEQLYERYARQEMEERCSQPRAVWEALLNSGRTLFSLEGLTSAERALDNIDAAWAHVLEYRRELDMGRQFIEAQTRYHVPPMGMFDAARSELLEECLKAAPRRLARF